MIEFQSTLPYGERRKNILLPVAKCPVSIHAPVWGATLRLRKPDCLNPVSIHAPVWGATDLAGLKDLGKRVFQSTLPYGERLDHGHILIKGGLFQSTLPYGERQSRYGPRSAKLRFQSTLPYGERRWFPPANPEADEVSIHAPVWGATRVSRDINIIQQSFNPRSHMGSDSKAREDNVFDKSFNPRSRMGSDPHPPRCMI